MIILVFEEWLVLFHTILIGGSCFLNNRRHGIISSGPAASPAGNSPFIQPLYSGID